MARSDILYVKFNANFLMYVLINKNHTKVINQGIFEMPEGLIQNAKIVKPMEFLKAIKAYFRSQKIHAKTVVSILPEEEMMIRFLEVPKVFMHNKSKKDVLEEVKKLVHIPFEHPTINYHIVEETETMNKVLFVVLDEDLLFDDTDFYEALGFRNISFDLPFLTLYRLMYQLEENEEALEQFPEKDGQMVAVLVDDYFSITIFDKEVPRVFMSEEFEDRNKAIEVLSTYIDRYCHYYQYQIHKGKHTVDDIFLINVTSTYRDQELLKLIHADFPGKNIKTYSSKRKKDPLAKEIFPMCRLVYGASLKGGKK